MIQLYTGKILANEQETFQRVVDYIRTNDVDCDLWVGKTVSAGIFEFLAVSLISYKLDVCMTEEVAAAGASIYERCKKAGGDLSGVEHITDRTEAVKVNGSTRVLFI